MYSLRNHLYCAQLRSARAEVHLCVCAGDVEAGPAIEPASPTAVWRKSVGGEPRSLRELMASRRSVSPHGVSARSVGALLTPRPVY